MKKTVSIFLGSLISGLSGAALMALIVFLVGTPFNIIPAHPILVMLWGLFISFGISFCLEYLSKKNSGILLKLVLAAFAGAITGLIANFLLTDGFAGGAIVGLLFGIFIAIGVHIVDKLTKDERKFRYFVLRLFVAAVVGFLFGLTSGLIWAFIAGGAHAEGFVLLVIGSMSALGMAWSIGILSGTHVLSEHFLRPNCFVWGLLFVVSCIVLLKSVDLANDKSCVYELTDLGHHTKDVVGNKNYDRADIFDFVKSTETDNASRDVALYLLSDDLDYAVKAKNILLKECRQQMFTSPANSVKSVQFDAAQRAWSYLQIRDLEGLFGEAENKELVTWFNDIVSRVFSVEWVDWLYAIAFGRKPVGPYENQEIGVAALSVLAESVERYYPETAKICREYIDSHAVVWNGNFRNTDDSVSYHSWWINSCYMVAKYRPRPEQLNNDNAREGFEWLLKQWPPNGIALGYNDFHTANLADTMAMGASLFHDGRYKWLANKMLYHADAGHEEFPEFYFGLALWDDSLQEQIPSTGSCCLSGPGRFPHNPGPNMPDKMVLRDGWSVDSLYALLNLRYSGWHKYKATNCVVTVIYGLPFVVEDLISKRHWWLPAGRALYRDKEIDRIRLNGLQLGLEGYELMIHDLLDLGSRWLQDPPQYAQIALFETTPGIDVGKTEISDWHRWKHSRVSAIVKGDNRYLVIIDNAKGQKKRNIGLSWHLKGNPIFEKDRIRLQQGEYKLDFAYPHSESWYQTKITDSFESDPPISYINAPNIDVQMLSVDASQAGFITFLLPVINDNNMKISNIDVRDLNGQSAYPEAMGAKIEFLSSYEIFGAKFETGTYNYEIAETDAEVFRLNMRGQHAEVNYFNASKIKFRQLGKPIHLIVDDVELTEGTGWNIQDDGLIVILPQKNGRLEVIWAK
ncbi:MAG: hypothetical protein JW804_04815 [Sedimentisphaerales bacterium]|nr:hypothetical protein [Sedimentisphaerales bacterium]